MPTRDTSWPAGTPCWVDYAADDLDAAKDFYAAVVGWTGYTDSRPEFGGYVNALVGDSLAAGLMPKMEPEIPSVWTTYFATDDADATVAAITAAGGTLIAGPHDVGTLGRMVIAVDPQGGWFGAWQGADHIGFQIYNEPGGVVWNEGAMEDPDAARAFYTAVFGFGFEEVPDSGGYTMITNGSAPLGGLGAHQPGAPQGWLTCFSVASCDQAAVTAESHGGKVLSAPNDMPYGRFAVLEDPWGAAFEVMQEPPGR